MTMISSRIQAQAKNMQWRQKSYWYFHNGKTTIANATTSRLIDKNDTRKEKNNVTDDKDQNQTSMTLTAMKIRTRTTSTMNTTTTKTSTTTTTKSTTIKIDSMTTPTPVRPTSTMTKLVPTRIKSKTSKSPLKWGHPELQQQIIRKEDYFRMCVMNMQNEG